VLLAENTGRKKSPKNSPSGHHRTTLSGWSFKTKARIDNEKQEQQLTWATVATIDMGRKEGGAVSFAGSWDPV